jgi:hypothetical protein
VNDPNFIQGAYDFPDPSAVDLMNFPVTGNFPAAGAAHVIRGSKRQNEALMYAGAGSAESNESSEFHAMESSGLTNDADEDNRR